MARPQYLLSIGLVLMSNAVRGQYPGCVMNCGSPVEVDVHRVSSTACSAPRPVSTEDNPTPPPYFGSYSTTTYFNVERYNTESHVSDSPQSATNSQFAACARYAEEVKELDLDCDPSWIRTESGGICVDNTTLVYQADAAPGIVTIGPSGATYCTIGAYVPAVFFTWAPSGCPACRGQDYCCYVYGGMPPDYCTFYMTGCPYWTMYSSVYDCCMPF